MYGKAISSFFFERSNQALTLSTYCYLDYASYQNQSFRPIYGFFGVIAETKHTNKIFTRQNFLSGKIFTGQNFLSNTRGYIFSKGQNFSPTKIFARKDNIRPSPNPPTPNVGGDDRFFSKKCS